MTILLCCQLIFGLTPETDSSPTTVSARGSGLSAIHLVTTNKIKQEPENYSCVFAECYFAQSPDCVEGLVSSGKDEHKRRIVMVFREPVVT
jgi:hypothetical protein